MTVSIWAGGVAFYLASLFFYGFGTINPNPQRWTMLSFFVAAMVVLWMVRGCVLPKSRLIVPVLAFVAYAGLSLSWSKDWLEGLMSLSVLIPLAGLFLALTHLDRKHLIRAVGTASAGAVIITTAIAYFEPGIFGGLGNENFQSEFLVLLIPLTLLGAYAFPQLGPAFVVLSIVALVQLFMNGSDAKLAALAGMLVLLTGYLVKHRMYRWAGALVLCCSAAAVVMVRGSALTSIRERVELTYNTLMIWKDNPVFGAGIGSFNHEYPFYQAHHLWVLDTKVVRMVSNFAGSAHNEFVQALAIFGVVGFGLLCWIAWQFRSMHKDPAGILGLITVSALAGLSLVGFPFQNTATAVLAVTALALVPRNECAGSRRA